MDRRRFLGAVAGLVVAPIAGALPALPPVVPWGEDGPNPLFRGELGRWEDIRIIDTQAVRVYSMWLAHEVRRQSRFRSLCEQGGPFVVMVDRDDRLEMVLRGWREI